MVLLVGVVVTEPGRPSVPVQGADHASSDMRSNATSTARPTGATATGSATIAQLVGQKLMVAMSGTTPSAELLGRIERGEVGGVILFSSNISTAAKLRALTKKLAHAAAAGGQPPLLIATDQEGGLVERVAWAPPTLSSPEMGDLANVVTAEAEGLATGYVLRCAGINTNLAPVADVPRSTASFMYERGRTWSFDASLTAMLSDAFASGLEAGGNIAVMKHFPGLGFANENTDAFAVTITATHGQLEPELLPYQAAIASGIPMIMLSNATYTAYDAANAAGWSHTIVDDLLRDDLGFQGVTITDSLSGTANARGVSARSLARKAAKAGTDMLMLTGSESGSASAFERLLGDAEDGSIPLATLQASYDRILALKATISGPVADPTPPTVVAPRSRLYAPSILGTGGAPVRTSWSAMDPCAISSYGLERRVGGSAWADQVLPRMRSTSIRQSLLVGSTYRYGAAATDGAGNTSERITGPFFRPLVRQSSTSNVTFSGPWTRTESGRFSGGATRHSSAGGATARYTFTGSSVGWVAAVGPGRGSADVYVDGAFRSTVSLNAGTPATRQIVFAASWADQGAHTIELVVAGTPGHPRVDVDAFVHLHQP